jgi:hypothetical protein
MAPRHPDKGRENLARRALKRQGFELSKSRRRDPMAPDYGQYTIRPVGGRRVVATLGSLEEVEAWTAGGR